MVWLPGRKPGSRNGDPLFTTPCETPSTKISTPSILDSKTSVPSFGGGALPARKPVGGGVLLALGRLADVAADVVCQLVGSHHPVTRLVCLALQPLHDVVSENAVTIPPVLAFKGPLTVPARRERKHRAGEIEQALVQLLRLGIRGNRAAVAGVGQQNLPLRPDPRAGYGAQSVHRITRSVDVRRVYVVRREVRTVAVNESVAGEIDHHAIVLFGH